MPATPSNGRRGQGGQAVLEFVLVTPFLLIFLFAIIDFGIGINRRVIITNAAREAARYGATGKSVSDIQQRVIQQSEGLVKNPADVSVRFFDIDGDGRINAGDTVAVYVKYSYQLLSPLPAFGSAIPTSFEMNACTDMRLEQVAVGAVPEAGGAPCQ